MDLNRKIIYKGTDGEKELQEFLKEKNNTEVPRINTPNVVTSIVNLSGYIQMPSGIYVSKERMFLGKNWNECHNELSKQGLSMITLPEFREFLAYLKNSSDIVHQTVYRNITEVRDPWRAEWIDAYFEKKGRKWWMKYGHTVNSNGDLVAGRAESLDDKTLMKDKTPGISLEIFLDSEHTLQGFPTKEVPEGNLYYWRPEKNAVARFVASSVSDDLGCSGGPSGRDPALGVRAVKRS